MTRSIGIIMGSQSDFPIMEQAGDVLTELGIEYSYAALSAHRTPKKVLEYAEAARTNGLAAIIAGAGGAAHLPGFIAGVTTLPVIGVPIHARISIDGWDSLLSIVQMPPGVPVATVGIDNARNAGILAAQIIGVADPAIADNLAVFKHNMAQKVIRTNDELQA